jgi:cytochrome c oxidase subunit 4
MSAVILPRKIYVLVWAGLLFLLLLTWGIAELNLGAFSVVAALTIAIVKTLLVILYFMHVRYSSRITWVFVAAGFIWFMIMVDLTLSDYLTRGARVKPASGQMPAHR